MGSVPAISALILGIVVPALAGYIEVCNLMVYSEPGHFGQHAGGDKCFRPRLCPLFTCGFKCLIPADVLTDCIFFFIKL